MKTARKLFMVAGLAWAIPGGTPVLGNPSPAPLTEFDRDFAFGYLSFETARTPVDGTVRINARDGKGGAGIHLELDGTRLADWSPTLTLKLGPNNRAAFIVLLLIDADENKRLFRYALAEANTDGFTTLPPEHGEALSPAVAGQSDDPFDIAAIRMVQVQGDWRSDPVDVVLDRIDWGPPNDSLEASRESRREELAKQAERKRQEEAAKQERLQALLTSAEHPADGAEILTVAPADRDLLSIVFQSGAIENLGQVPYQAREGDQIKGGDDTNLVWRRGDIAREPMHRRLERQRDKHRETVGDYFEPYGAWVPTLHREQLRGTLMAPETLDRVEAYRISSTDDPSYDAPVHPTQVFVKSKNNGVVHHEYRRPVLHTVYLRMPAPLREGATYTLAFPGLNCRDAEARYRHTPRETRAEAIHVNQIGYHPKDPFKRAYLSLWTGTGEAHPFNADTFQLLDAGSGASVFQGAVVEGFAADRNETLPGDKNHCRTPVYYLDFPDFCTPGTYRVFVPGIGVSYPFPLAETAWRDAFRTSMHGFLSHRSGIALGPPVTDYVRPRNMHPADGFKIFRLKHTLLDGEADTVLADLEQQLGENMDADNLTTHPGAWGGYMDAGDWDRRSLHLDATYRHLELLELYPDKLAGIPLTLPPDEANDNLPDLLNEALWNIDFYGRLQEEEGGVGGGVESTAHPRDGEASWQETLLLGAFAPDPASSYRFAANAAKAARLLAAYDQKRADTLATNAAKAYAWAQSYTANVLAEVVTRSPNKNRDRLQTVVDEARELAGIELAWLTGDPAYLGPFEETGPLRNTGDQDSRTHALFAYARLPDELGDPAQKQASREAILRFADSAIDYANGNAFNIANINPYIQLMGYLCFYSVPEAAKGPVLPRAYALTGDPTYLRAAVAATHYTAGANPMNLCLTTGVGRAYPRWPLHIDSRVTGQPAPRGITVYGQSDPGQNFDFDRWVHIWYLRETTPNSFSWPASEAYMDLGNWPAANEYTIHQTLGKVSYYWGFLAACERKP